MAQTNATENFILQRLDDGLTAVNGQMFVLLTGQLEQSYIAGAGTQTVECKGHQRLTRK